MTTESTSALAPELAELHAEAAAEAAAEKNKPVEEAAQSGSGKAEPAAGAGEDEMAASVEAAAAALGAADLPAETWEDWAGAIDMALEWFSDAYPALATVYTPARKERIARAMHAVAKKHGWTLAGLFLKWKEEITLVLVLGPALRDTRKIVAQGRAAATPPPGSRPTQRPDVLRPNE